MMVAGLIGFSIGNAKREFDEKSVLQETINECTQLIREGDAMLSTSQYNADIVRIQTILYTLGILKKNIEDVGHVTEDAFEFLIQNMSDVHQGELFEDSAIGQLSGVEYNRRSVEKRIGLIQGLMGTYSDLLIELRTINESEYEDAVIDFEPNKKTQI